jgi:catalase
MHRQAINRGRVSYEPNSLAGGCPFQAGAAGFVSFPQPTAPVADKVRGKPERFADHYTQATLFWNSQTDVEKAHIVNAFRFELSRVQTPAVRERMVSGLMHVAAELAEAVAAGLGMRELPAPMPKVLPTPVTPEVDRSPALSLLARPGDGSVRARRVAILVADGADGAPLVALADRLVTEGAVPRFVGSRLGSAAVTSGESIAVDASLEATPSVLYDAVVLPDGDDAVDALAMDGRTTEFLKDQYRHCKPILALGNGKALLEGAGIPLALPSGDPDPGLILGTSGDESVVGAFLGALAKHRHFERETDPPLV